MPHRRTLCTVALLTSVVLLLPAPSGAITAIGRAERERREVSRLVADLRAVLHDEVSERAATVSLLELTHARGGVIGGETWATIMDAAERHSERRADAISRLRTRVTRRIDHLRARRERITAWLDSLIFRVCPLASHTQIYDDFGEMVRLPGVPVHRHEGSDVTAPAGTAIRAPFDGYASSSYGTLGGLEVRVSGRHGYIYNAHLSAVGRLGWVRAGTIIGYVGATGDATAAHDHIEWHPGDGAAVDPYPLLAQACLPV